MLPRNLRRLVRAQDDRIDGSGAPMWRPFAVCQRGPVATAFGRVQFAGVAAPASSVLSLVVAAVAHA
jgi:hypothetical protein